uniref:PiggyBac transposable element-derived protein domain-containing protein n=1 Tax=Clastoptera arizonana TaxID=38151 RepID=A0A1B6EF99_9HEMI
MVFTASSQKQKYIATKYGTTSTKGHWSCKTKHFILALCDTKTLYIIKLEVYYKTQLERPWKTINNTEDVVKILSEHIYESDRNITANSWFTAVNLVYFLKSKKLFYVGTLKK